MRAPLEFNHNPPLEWHTDQPTDQQTDMDSDISTTNNLLWYNNLVPMVVYSPFKNPLQVICDV